MSEESVSSSGSEEESSYEDDEEDEQTDSTAPTTSPQISPVDTGAAIITPITTTPTPTPTPDPNLANSLTPTTPATPDSGVPLANTVNPTNTVNHETVSVLPGIVNGVDSVVSGSAVSGVPDVSGTQPVVNSFEPPTASFSVSRSTAVPPCAFPTPNYLPNEAARFVLVFASTLCFSSLYPQLGVVTMRYRITRRRRLKRIQIQLLTLHVGLSIAVMTI